MKSAISLDGVSYPGLHVAHLERSFEILDGKNAGRLMNGDMARDIIGTYYNYSLEIDPYNSNPVEYDAFYEAISAPVDSHILVVPYAQWTLTFRAYATKGQDELILCGGNRNDWDGLTVNFIAMSPQRRPA